MMKFAALTHRENTPSSRFRVRSLLPSLRDRGIEVSDLSRRYSTEQSGVYFPKTRISSDARKAALAIGFHIADIGQTLVRTLQTRHYSGSWVSRELVSGHRTWEPLLKKPMFYDIDDAVFLKNKIGRAGVNYLIKNAACVFAGNEFLADYCHNFSDRVLIVPTSVDQEKFYPDRSWRPSDKFKVVWSGTSTSFPYIKKIESALCSFFSSTPDARLHIYSDRYPSELGSLKKYIDFAFWRPEAELAQIQDADVGIMPIPETDWARGKCSYKMLLYAACGVPCVVSNFGMNSEVLDKGRVGLGCATNGDWLDALQACYQQRDFIRDLFPDGPEVIKCNYSLELVANTVSSAMHLHSF